MEWRKIGKHPYLANFFWDKKTTRNWFLSAIWQHCCVQRGAGATCGIRVYTEQRTLTTRSIDAIQQGREGQVIYQRGHKGGIKVTYDKENYYERERRENREKHPIMQIEKISV